MPAKREIKQNRRELLRFNFEERKRKKEEEDYEKRLKVVFSFLDVEQEKLEGDLQVVNDKRQENNYKSSSLKSLKYELGLKLRMLEKHREILNACNSKFIAASREIPGKERESIAMPLDCGSQLCPRCSENKSAIHRRKIRRIASWLLELRCNDGTTPMLHSYVFTIPQTLRKFFVTKVMLDKLFKVASDAIMNTIAPQGTICTLHGFGDEKDTFSPHINVLFGGMDNERNRLSDLITKEKLKEIRESFLLEVIKLLPSDFVETLPDEFVKQSSNCHRSFKSKQGQKLHIVGYVTRGTIDIPKLANGSQEIIDLFLYKLSPCKVDGLKNSSMSGKGRGFRYTRYFGQYSCGNRKKFLEANLVVINKRKPFEVDDDTDIPFEIVSHFDKPIIFHFYMHSPLGVHKKLNLQMVDLDYWFFENQAIGGDSMV